MGRVEEGNAIADYYLGDVMKVHKNEMTVKVTSAVQLSQAELDLVKMTLRTPSWTTEGQRVNLKVEVDPSLIGGLHITAGARILDMSVKSKLQTIVNAMSKEEL